MSIIFFESSSDFRKWLEQNHSTESELWVGFYKRGSGKPSITWPESVDQALCFGWIDGVRKSIDEQSYKIRFTPRKTDSIWSAINIRRVTELTEKGLMQSAGLKAFESRQENKAGKYSYENRPASLPPEYEKIFKKNKAAWEFFQSTPAWYRKTSTWWVISAKRDETKLMRLQQLMDFSAEGRTVLDLKRSKN